MVNTHLGDVETSPRSVSEKNGKKFILTREFTVLLALAVIFITFSLFSKDFLGPFIFPGILLLGSELAILAMGETFVIVSGEIDLSIASVYGWGAVIGTVLSNLGFPFPVSFLLAIGFGCLIGLGNGLLTVKFKIPALITTLGTMWILRGLLIGGFGGSFISYKGEKSFLLSALGGRIGYFPRLFFWFIGIALLFNYLLNHSKLGNWIQATGGSRETARALGVNVNRTKIICFMISSALAAFAGAVYIARTDWFMTRIGMSSMGYGMEIEAIAASVMGGTAFSGGVGSIVAVSLAAFAFSSFKSGLILAGASGYWIDAAVALLLIIFCLLQGMGRGKNRM
ncbi:MAG: ABC transporter permease [Candidatus Atribacteria bacterium]|nr:ABC transporter permease [Candidatus Atribacteria bacterium]